jgi:hypothetical protein
MIRLFAATLLLSLTAVNAAQSTSRVKTELNSASVNSAAFGERSEKASLIVKAEVVLDRAHYSPGQIDGKDGENFRKALKAFQQANNLTSTGNPPAKLMPTLGMRSPPICPSRRLSPIRSPRPTSLALLRAVNPGVDFDRAGQTIAVANVEPLPLHRGNDSVEVERPRQHQGAGGSAATVVVDKPAREVRAYDKEGKLLAIRCRFCAEPAGMFSHGHSVFRNGVE